MQRTADRLVTEQLSAMFGLLGRAHLVEGTVSRAEYTLLALTAKRGPGRACALADAVGLDQSTTSRRVSALVERGYLERTPDPDDGRAQLVGLTGDGREVLATERRRREELVGIALADWSDGDRAALGDLLGRLQTSLARVARDHDHTVRSVAGPTAATAAALPERTSA